MLCVPLLFFTKKSSIHLIKHIQLLERWRGWNIVKNILNLERNPCAEQHILRKKLQSDAEFLSEITERMKVRKDVEDTLAIEAEEKGCFQ